MFARTLLVGLLLSSHLFGQGVTPPGQGYNMPGWAKDEILRRGDSVTHINGFQASPSELAQDALKPPADDSHKWFITVIHHPTCQPCQQLLSDWKRSESLQAFAKPQDPQKGWAFYNAYSANDKLQQFRWKDIKIKGYPTILIQPPRNRTYGDPATVVLQLTGYDGDDRALANRFTEGIKAYVTKLREKSPVRELETPKATSPEAEVTDPVSNAFGQQPPFDVAPPAPTVDVPPLLPNQPPSTPTPNQPAPTPNAFSALSVLLSALLSVLGGSGMTNTLMVSLIAVQIWRAYRKATGQPLLLDDATFAKIAEHLTKQNVVTPTPTKSK